MSDKTSPRAAGDVLCLHPNEGRHYDMGGLTARFLADEEETASAYSVSEWRLEPGHEGVGAHHHDANVELFYVLEGTPQLLTGETWHDCQPGSFLRIPAGVTHNFRNPGTAPARLLNVFIPGGFERNMPEIVAWFAGQKS
jgi:mannose-6-phosphate isomerase-like protein (cupin superfamily)